MSPDMAFRLLSLPAAGKAGSHLLFVGPWGCREPSLSPPVAISQPGVGVLQNDGCRKILSPSQNTSHNHLLPFAQGDWLSGRERKEWGKDCVYFLHKAAWGSASFQDIWLIAQLKECWKTFTSFISLEEGSENKKYVCFYLLPFSPSSICPLILHSSPPQGGKGRTAEQGAVVEGSPEHAQASQTQLQNSLLIFTRKLEHFIKWKIFS